MKKLSALNLFMLLLLGLALVGCGGSGVDSVEAASKTEKAGLLDKLMSNTETVVIPQGTPVTVRLQQSISSATAASGDNFDFVLASPLVVNGKTLAEAGAPGTGRVVAARKSGRLHNAGYLRLALATIEVGGKQVPVQSSSVIASGGSYKKRNWAWIGGGAGAGALIGGLAGGGKGALIGSAVGAGAGTGAAYATGKKEVAFGAERQLTFKLSQPVEVEVKR